MTPLSADFQEPGQWVSVQPTDGRRVSPTADNWTITMPSNAEPIIEQPAGSDTVVAVVPTPNGAIPGGNSKFSVDLPGGPRK